MKRLHLLPALILFLLISCGKSRSDSKKTATINQQDIETLLENQRFQCASLGGDQCPDGLARLFIINPIDANNSALCTGFLTSSNRLVTNHHCLSSLDQCRNTFIAIHQDGTHQVARCQSIIKSLDDGNSLATKSIDVSILELDRHLNIDPFSLTKNNPLTGSKVSAWVVDHLDLFQARLTELECRSEGEEFSLEFSRCPAISGNSGSPMVNSSGWVVGVLWGSTLDNRFNESLDLEFRRNLSAFSFATDVKYFKQYSSP